MISLIAAFFTSFIITIIIICTEKLHGMLSADTDLNGPQKFHNKAVPRIGGLAIVLGIFMSITISFKSNIEGFEKLLLFFCILPVFGIGILEDLTKKVSIRKRLIFTAFSALLASLYLNARINNLDIPGIDLLLTFPAASIIFTVFAVTGLVNAYNIIDGFNGLTSMVGIITLLALGYMGIKLNDPIITYLSLVMASAILGFFLLNYPRGLIFLGDGGAYLIGFWVAILSVLIINRNPEISPWFALMINAYPISETLFTIYRRKFHQDKNPGHPDGIHFHSLIFRRILNHGHIKKELVWFNANSKTSPYLWVLSSITLIPAINFWDSTPLLMVSYCLFTIFYLWLYKKMITFKTPKWMHL